MTGFDRDTAIVTGAGHGIGLAIAHRLFESGATVVLADRDADALEKAIARFHADDRVHALLCDVANADDIAQLAAAADRVGPLTILVNNAGISPKRDGRRVPVFQTTEAEWREVLDINLTGAFRCARACLPQMRANRYGRIVNISSQAGRGVPKIAGAHYAASKAGILGLTRALAAECAGDGITVNAVAPGRIETPMASGAATDVNARFLEGIPVGRFGTCEDVAAAVAFLASREAGFITGATLDVNGGSHMS